MERDVFYQVCRGLLAELENHRQDIEGPDMNWFSVKVLMNHRSGEIKATWQQETSINFGAESLQLTAVGKKV